MTEHQMFIQLVKRLEESISEMRKDIRDMRDTLVKHEGLVGEVDDLKDRVTELERSSDRNSYLVKIGDKLIYAVLGGVLVAALKIIGVM